MAEDTEHNEDYYISQLPEELQDVLKGNKDILNVQVITPDTYVKPYPIGLPPHWKRKAFILNITDGIKFTKREGAEIDTVHLTALFTELDFQITKVPDSETDKKNIEKNLKEFVQKCKDDEVDCFVIFIGSHGADGIIKTSDGEFLDVYHDIIYPCQFTVHEKENKSVKQVVRIFINQSCQEDPPQGISKKAPDVVMKDSIYVAAQIVKFKAAKDPYFGSYFVLVLTYVFKTKAWNTHLVELFLEVQDLLPKVAKCGEEIQFPPMMLGLRQHFYFFKNPYDFEFDVWHPVNLFTGRKAELMDLHSKFQQQNSINLDAKKVAIVGLGGIGKSELARVYCQHFVGAVIWLNAETEESLAHSFRTVAKVLSKNADGIEKTITTIVSEVFKYFIGKPCLFVFDNVEDVDIFQKFTRFPQPNATPPFILITSQVNRWTFKDEELLELYEMTEADAVELVKKGLTSAKEIQNNYVIQLTKTLQCLPLALSQAISYINREDRLIPNAIGHYLELHRSSSKIPFVSGTSLGFHRYTKTIYTTFRLQINRISSTQDCGENAIILLNILSYFQPDKIPTKLLLSGDIEDANQALHLLLDFSVVNIESKHSSIRIHRLLQAVVRLEVRENQVEERALRDSLVLLSQNASEDTAVHLFSVLKYCNNLKDLNLFVDHALSVHFQDPNIMTSFLNSPNGRKCITIEKNGNNDEDWLVTMDLSDLLAIGSNPRHVQETYILSHLLQTNKKSREEIIDTPLVQLFMEIKWDKMQWVIRTSMVFQITWTITTFLVIWSIFMTKYENIMSADDWELLENKSWNLFPENEFQKDFSDIVVNSSIFLIFFTSFLAAREVLEVIITPKFKIYIIPKENWGQWLLITLIYVLLSNLIFPQFLSVWLDYNLSIIAMITSCLLLLVQSKKHTKSGLYKEVSTQTFRKVGWLFLWFSCILVLFNIGVRFMIPLLEKFALWPPFGSQEFGAMLTGDYSIDDICGPEADAVEILKTIFPLILTAMVVIALNILFVDWNKNLERRARMGSLATQLEQLHLMEAFVTKILGWYPDLAEACRITGNRSIMTVWPLSYLKLFWESLTTSTKQNSTVLAINQLLYSEKNSHVIKKPLKDFSKECKSVLIKLQAERDAMQTN